MTITVKDLAAQATILAGRSGLDREVSVPHLIIPDLTAPTAGKDASLCVLHLRPSQVAYLSVLPKSEKNKTVKAILKQRPACIMISGGAVCRELLESAEAAGIPVIKSRRVPDLHRHLSKKITSRVSLHGVLVQIFGLGALILGESAVGKSEAALDLVLRGHKLVADDMVMLEKSDEGVLGSPTELGADLLQIRGLGIINVRALYGESATVSECKVGLVVELEEWQKGHQYSLVGLREKRYRLLGVNLPYLKLPVKPGRNMATLIEVAARNQMLKSRGIFTARDLNKKLKKRLAG